MISTSYGSSSERQDTYSEFEDTEDPLVQASVLKETLSSLGNTDHEADEEKAKGDEDLDKKSLDVGVLHGRIGIGEEASSTAVNHDNEDGDNDDGDGLKGVSGEVNHARGLPLATSFSPSMKHETGTYAQGEHRIIARNLGGFCARNEPLAADLQQNENDIEDDEYWA